MGHEQKGSDFFEQKLLEPLDGLDIEVVRWFVEQQHVGIADERLGEQYTSLHASREGRYFHVGFEAHLRQDGFHTLLDSPTVGHFQLVADPVETTVQGGVVVGCQLDADVMKFGKKSPLPSQSGGDQIVNRSFQIVWHLLVHQRRGDALASRHLTAIGGELIVEDTHERGLPLPIAPDQADALTAIHGKVSLVQQEWAVELMVDMAKVQQSHALFLERDWQTNCRDWQANYSRDMIRCLL